MEDLILKLLLKQTQWCNSILISMLILILRVFYTYVRARVFVLIPHIGMHALTSLLFFLSLYPSHACTQIWCVTEGKLACKIFLFSKKKRPYK